MSVQKTIVVLDTNILENTAENRKIADSFIEISKSEHAKNIELVLTRTVLLEFEQRMNVHIDGDKKRARKDAAFFKKLGVDVNLDNANYGESLNIHDELDSLGFSVRVEEPTIEDFQRAHERACLHIAPQPNHPDAEEQTRDLIILEMSLRLARDNGKAMLATKDKIFWSRDETYVKELKEAGLVRYRSLHEAASVSGAHFAGVLDMVIGLEGKFIEAGIPITEGSAWSSLRVKNMRKNGEIVTRLWALVSIDPAKAAKRIDLEFEYHLSDDRAILKLLNSTQDGARLESIKTCIEFKVTNISKDINYNKDIEELRKITREGK